MEKLKRLRLCRSVASMLVPLMAVPCWLVASAPGLAQGAPPPPPPPPPALGGTPPTTAPAPPPLSSATTGTTRGGAASQSAPPPAVNPSPSMAPAPAPIQPVTSPVPTRVGPSGALRPLIGGNLLVWPADVRSVNGDDTLAVQVEQAIVTAFVGNPHWQAGALRSALDQDNPSVRRLLLADRSGDLAGIVHNPLPPSPMDAERVANGMDFASVMLSSLDRLNYNPATHIATAELTASIYDSRTPTSVTQVGGTASVSGSSGTSKKPISESTAKSMAIEAAARNLAASFGAGLMTNGESAAGLPAAPRRSSHTLMKVLPWVLGAAAIAAIAVIASNNSSGNSQPAFSSNSFAAPTNALAIVMPTNGNLGVDLQFSQSSAANLVQKYLVVRHGPDGDRPIDTLIAQGAGPVFTTFDPTATPGLTYTYTVQAIGYNGEKSNLVNFALTTGSTNITLGKPAPPTNLSAQTAGHTVVLSWQPSPDAAFVSGYIVQRRDPGAGGFVTISTVIPATTYTDNNPALGSGQTFSYRVLAVSNTNPSVTGDPSGVLAVVIP